MRGQSLTFMVAKFIVFIILVAVAVRLLLDNLHLVVMGVILYFIFRALIRR